MLGFSGGNNHFLDGYGSFIHIYKIGKKHRFSLVSEWIICGTFRHWDII